MGLKNAGAKSVQGATIGGTHTWQILRNLASKLQELQEQKSKKILYVSAGVNDALAYAITSGVKRATQNGLPRGMPSQPFFTPEITSKEIDKIATLAKSKGYDIKFRLVGPAPFKGNVDSGMGTIDPSRFNEFSQKVNSHMASRGYSTFATNVAMKSDGIHPTSGGYTSLLSSINSGAASSVSSSQAAKKVDKTKKSVTSTDKDNLIIIGDSNSGAFAKKWYGRGSQSRLEDPGYFEKEHGNRAKSLMWFQHKGKVLAPSIGSGATWDVYNATKRFFELKGENYKPTTAIIHMGYNFLGYNKTYLSYKQIIDFLKSKGVTDIRIMELKANKNQKMKQDAINLSAKLRKLADESGLTFITNPGKLDSSGYHFGGSYDKMYNAAMSGISAPAEKPKVKTKIVKKTSGDSKDQPAVDGFASFITKKARATASKTLAPFGSFNEVMDSVTQIFKAAAEKVNLQVSENPTVEDLRRLQGKLGIDDDGWFGSDAMAAISLINSKYANKVVSENLSNAINLNSHLTKPFRSLMEQSLNKLLQEQTSFGVIDVDNYVDNYASSASLLKAYRGAVSRGLEVKKPSVRTRAARKDKSWREDKQFLRKVKAYSNKNNVDPKMFLAFMAHETAGTFSPYMTNSSGCVGLIQFCTTTGMVTIGKSASQLRAMSRSEQWNEVEKFYDSNKNYGWHKGGGNISTLYMITFSPHFSVLGPNDIIYSEDPSRAHQRVKDTYVPATIKRNWKGNPANWDPRDPSVVTKWGLEQKLKKMYKEYDITDKLFDEV